MRCGLGAGASLSRRALLPSVTPWLFSGRCIAGWVWGPPTWFHDAPSGCCIRGSSGTTPICSGRLGDDTDLPKKRRGGLPHIPVTITGGRGYLYLMGGEECDDGARHVILDDVYPGRAWRPPHARHDVATVATEKMQGLIKPETHLVATRSAISGALTAK